MPTLLVTGASGQLGRRVIELLLASGHRDLIATTRHPEKLADLAAQGVTVRTADFDEPKALAHAFAGADRVLIVSTDALDRPGHRLEQHLNAVRAAEAAGIKHVVYTSIVYAEPDALAAVATDHHNTEQAILQSGMGYTILRNNLYAETLIGSIGRALAGGQWVAATGAGKAAYVTREDCARAAAAALSADFDGRRTLDITGSESLSHAELAAHVAALTGLPLAYLPIPVQALVEGMSQMGLPAPIAELVASFDAAIAAGQLDGVSSAVNDLTGTPAQSARVFLAANLTALTTPPTA